MIDPTSTTLEIGGAACATAVLGIGSFEQHSAHLPVDTDFYLAGRLAREVASRLGAVLLNPLPYSTSPEHRGFAGTVTLKPDTLKNVIWDLAESAGEWGIRHLVLLNAHGGNFILNPAARQWNMDGRRPYLLLVDFYSGLSGTVPNLHAGEVETSLMLFLDPQRVRGEYPPDFVPSWSREELTHLGMKTISPTGVWGYPSKATAAKGERWFKEAVQYCLARVEALLGVLAARPES